MKASILSKLEGLSERLEEINALLGSPEVIADNDRFIALAKEHAELNPVVGCYSKYQAVLGELAAAREMLEDTDPEMQDLAQEEIESAEREKDALEPELQRLLLPQDPADQSNIFLEIRAGTGGDEAALFAGDLLRMYLRYAEMRRWSCEVMSESLGEHGGYKEVIVRIVGRGAYSRLKFESGGHRVQRVPRPSPKAGFTPRPARSPSCRRSTRSTRSRSTARTEDRYLPRLGCGRSARQQDRLGHPHHPSAHQHRGRMSGRTLSAQESGARHVAAACAAARRGARPASA